MICLNPSPYRRRCRSRRCRCGKRCRSTLAVMAPGSVVRSSPGQSFAFRRGPECRGPGGRSGKRYRRSVVGKMAGIISCRCCPWANLVVPSCPSYEPLVPVPVGDEGDFRVKMGTSPKAVIVASRLGIVRAWRTPRYFLPKSSSRFHIVTPIS